MQIAAPILTAIEELHKLPGIGKKTAQRLTLFILNRDSEQVDKLILSIKELKEKIKFCSRCFNFSEDELCSICNSGKRDHTLLCIVEEASDIISIEKSNEFFGVYHVLGGVLSPLSGITPDSLHIKELLKRLEIEDIIEIIIALNPDTEGEATSIYLSKLIKITGKRVSRIARGLPMGGDLEFADEATIGRALINRVDY